MMYFVVSRRIFSSILVIWCSIFLNEASAACYFPEYLQGEYLMQLGSATQSQVRYTEVISITSEAISSWGYCFKKIGNDSYLIENMTNNTYCIRCFHISIKSPNILVARTSYNPDRCFISQPAAESSCPRAELVDVTKQMILYKTSQGIKKENCPINGRYMMRYRQHKADDPVECSSRTSDISNCPVGSELRVHFQDCSIKNHVDLTFECLGTWNGPSNQQYLALFDTRAAEEERPQYRCGLYLEDSGNGIVYIAFSSDSTCHTDLKSSQSGYETLVLTPYPNLQFQPTKCRFPSWMAGRWELVTVDTELNLFTYRDNVLFTTYTFQCLNYDESEKRYDFPLSIPNEDYKILVYGRTHCGEELYTCMWVKFRSPNVFEFQIGKLSSPVRNETLCSSSYFQPNVWITQARRDYLHNSPCPIVGEYFGTIPNAEGVCAKLSSDCSSPDTMYYTVSDCGQQTYEDREYRCLGQWQENGLTYTFTERKHVGTFECFVGWPLSGTAIVIREAGRHCERSDPPLLGMELSLKSSCADNRTSPTTSSYSPSTQTVPATVTTTRPATRRISPSTSVTKPWRPILPNVTRTQPASRSKTVNNVNNSKNNVPSQILTFFLFYWCYSR